MGNKHIEHKIRYIPYCYWYFHRNLIMGNILQDLHFAFWPQKTVKRNYTSRKLSKSWSSYLICSFTTKQKCTEYITTPSVCAYSWRTIISNGSLRGIANSPFTDSSTPAFSHILIKEVNFLASNFRAVNFCAPLIPRFLDFFEVSE